MPTESSEVIAGAQEGTLAMDDPTNGGTRGIPVVTAEPEPTGLLTVLASASPFGYIPVPAQIEIDGIPRDFRQVSALPLSPGTHVVSFRDAPGFGTPPPFEVTIVEGAHRRVAWTYSTYGYLRVVTEPAVPATISVDGIPRDDWGLWMAVPPGEHVVSFGTVDGHRPPADASVVVNLAETTTVTGLYERNPGARGPDPSTYGRLHVTTALSTGSPGVPSKILVDGMERDEWALSFLKLPLGVHEVSFSGIPGLGTAPPREVTIVARETTSTVGVFELEGWLRVETEETVPGVISVDGIPRNTWGMWQSLPTGTYNVSFGPVPGYTAPPAQVVDVRPQGTARVVGHYIPQPPENRIGYEFYDFFNVPYEEWWDMRAGVYGDMPINAECFSPAAVTLGICVPSDPDVKDTSAYPYTNWYPLPGSFIPGNANNNPVINAPYRLRVTGTNVSGYSRSEPVFLPILNYGQAPGNRLEFNWRMQYLSHSDALARRAAGCPAPNNINTRDGFEIQSWINLTMDLQESKRMFGVVATDATTARAWWSGALNGVCIPQTSFEISVEDWFFDLGNGKYDIYNSFEYFYSPFWTNILATVDGDGTTHVNIEHVAWGTEVLLARMFYWGNASYADNYLDSTKAAGWWGMELAWFEDFTFRGSLRADRFDFILTTAMHYHLTEAALPGPNGLYDRTDDVPTWSWGPTLTDYTDIGAPVAPYSELDRYPDPPYRYVHSTPGSPTTYYGVARAYDYVPIAWNLRELQSWNFRFPQGPVVFYDPNLTPVGADPTLGLFVEVRAPLARMDTNPAGFGSWDPATATWIVEGPLATGGPGGTPGPDGLPGTSDDEFAVEPWGSIRFIPSQAQQGPSSANIGEASAAFPVSAVTPSLTDGFRSDSRTMRSHRE